LISVTLANFSTPSYAETSFGEDCQTCHQSGIIVLTNATHVVQIETNSSFYLEVSASGGEPDQMTVVWSNVSHNAYFSFNPKEVEDNRSHDSQSEGGNITALFEVSAPSLEGNFTLRTYAASAQGRGGFVEVDVTVGAGGEIPETPKTPLEIMIEWLTVPIPYALGGVAMLGIILYLVVWRRIPGGPS
jgi:hypothetical protein